MRVRLVAGLTAVACAASFWLSDSLQAQRRGAQPTQQQQEQMEGLALAQYVRDVMTGVAVPPDATLTWDSYYVKSQGDQVYVPFTVALAPDMLARQVAMFFTVVPKGPQMMNFAANPQEGSDDMVDIEGELLNTASGTAENVKLIVTMLAADGKALGTQDAIVPSVPGGQRVPFKASVKVPRDTAQYSVLVEGSDSVFRDLSFTELPNPSRNEPVRVSRAFVAPAGEYDLFLVLRERPRGADMPPKIALLHESVSIPDLNADLTTSSIFVAEKIEPLSSPLNSEDQMKQPFTLGTMAIDPVTSTSRPQSGELSIIFFVYNAAVDPAKKPNVEIQYNFHRKSAEGESFFNRTNPQEFSAQTLPQEFDLSQGHQIVGGQSVPLGSFDPGEYRLEIKVNDKLNGKTVTRNVPFTVVS